MYKNVCDNDHGDIDDIFFGNTHNNDEYNDNDNEHNNHETFFIVSNWDSITYVKHWIKLCTSELPC